jgi:hypothetical protein
LSSLGGQSIRFRFRIGTDTGVADCGWFVDDLRLYMCGPPPADTDRDGVTDTSDNCPSVADPDQADLDADRSGDACDPDDDNDGITDTSDNYRDRAAATIDGCPAVSRAGGGSAGGSGDTGASGGTPAGDTLQSVRVHSCRRTGRGRRAPAVCTLTRFGAVRRVSVRITRHGLTYANRSGPPTSTGRVTVRPRRDMPRATYRVTITLRDARGVTLTIAARLSAAIMRT